MSQPIKFNLFHVQRSDCCCCFQEYSADEITIVGGSTQDAKYLIKEFVRKSIDFGCPTHLCTRAHAFTFYIIFSFSLSPSLQRCDGGMSGIKMIVLFSLFCSCQRRCGFQKLFLIRQANLMSSFSARRRARTYCQT